LLIPGIRRVDLSGPNGPEQMALNEAKAKIQSIIIQFPIASATLTSEERDVVNTVVARLKDVLSSSSDAEGTVIHVIGHSDSTGAEATNETLSQRRAERVSEEMAHLGIASKNLKPLGVASTEPLRSEDSEENRQYNRSVTFKIDSGSP
jgi:outer membrane protein OmpA-like peptidoglycan-associated protein